MRRKPRGHATRRGRSRHGGQRTDAGDSSGAAPGASLSRPRLPFPGLRSAIRPGSPHPALGQRRPHHAVEPRAALSLAPPGGPRKRLSDGATARWRAALLAPGRPTLAGPAVARHGAGRSRPRAASAACCAGASPARADGDAWVAGRTPRRGMGARRLASARGRPATSLTALGGRRHGLLARCGVLQTARLRSATPSAATETGRANAIVAPVAPNRRVLWTEGDPDVVTVPHAHHHRRRGRHRPGTHAGRRRRQDRAAGRRDGDRAEAARHSARHCLLRRHEFPRLHPGAPEGPEQIFETIDRIRRERRLTILLVEQRVLETGRVVLDGPRDALLADTRVQRAYLGG